MQLYNYSRDELKDILMEDKYMIPELNKAISKNISSSVSSSESIVPDRLCLQRRSVSEDKKPVIELNYE